MRWRRRLTTPTGRGFTLYCTGAKATCATLAIGLRKPPVKPAQADALWAEIAAAVLVVR